MTRKGGQQRKNGGSRRVYECVPEEERHLSGDGGSDGIDDLKGQSDPVLETSCAQLQPQTMDRGLEERTSVFIRALVADRAQELVEQVPMCVMDFDDI